MRFVNTLLFSTLFYSAQAFVPSHQPGNNGIILGKQQHNIHTQHVVESLVALSETSKKKGGLDGNLKNKLLSESIAPWRTLRLFFYGSLGSGAFIGGLINTSGAIAGSASPDFNLNTEVGIIISVLLLFGLSASILRVTIPSKDCVVCLRFSFPCSMKATKCGD
jgi:hypothetical protein